MTTDAEVKWRPSKTAQFKSLGTTSVHKAEAHECLLLAGALAQPQGYSWGWEVRRDDEVVAFGVDRDARWAKRCAENVASLPIDEVAKLYAKDQATHCSQARPKKS